MRLVIRNKQTTQKRHHSGCNQRPQALGKFFFVNWAFPVTVDRHCYSRTVVEQCSGWICVLSSYVWVCMRVCAGVCVSLSLPINVSAGRCLTGLDVVELFVPYESVDAGRLRH